MMDTAKVKMSTDKSINQKPTTNKCIIMALNYLNDSEDINTGPNGGEYMQFDSFVVITREGNEYKYYVRLVEETGETYYGVDLIDRPVLSEKKLDYIKKISKIYSLDGGIESDKEKLKTKGLNITYPEDKAKTICEGGIISYHPGYKLK